jgi:Na+-driven multidrug efflux pump
MDTLVGIMRGLGYAILPMFVSLTGACLLRVVWVMTVFQAYRSLKVLYISYPVTWIVTASTHLICLIIVYRKTAKAHSEVI